MTFKRVTLFENSSISFILFHDFIIKESRDLLPVVQSTGLGALHFKQNAFIYLSNLVVHAHNTHKPACKSKYTLHAERTTYLHITSHNSKITTKNRVNMMNESNLSWRSPTA